jgi:hypothetical protein
MIVNYYQKVQGAGRKAQGTRFQYSGFKADVALMNKNPLAIDRLIC